MDEKRKNKVIDLQSAKAALEKRQEDEAVEMMNGGSRVDKSQRKRTIAFVLVLVVVLGAVCVAVFWDKINIDGLRRMIFYAGVSHSEDGKTDSFEYESSTSNSFAALGTNVIVLTNNEISVCDKDGFEVYQSDITFATPAVDVGKEAAVAYDIGGTGLVAFNSKTTLLSLTLDKGLGFISASMNGSDWLAVTAQKSGNKGSISVYDANMNLVFEFNSSERFVTNAYVTEDCNYLVAQTLAQENGAYVSGMVIYQLKSDQPHATFNVENAMVLDIGALGGKVFTVSDNKFVVAAANSGEITATYEYNREYLRGYSLDGDGYAVLLLNKYRAGSVARLVSLNYAGEEIGSLDIDEEVLDISVSGRYIAVLYANRLVIYTKDLSEYAVSEDMVSTKNICMRSDGSVWTISASEIGLLIP